MNKQKYTTILGEELEVEEKEPIFNTHDIGFVTIISFVFIFIVTITALIVTPKLFGKSEAIWVDSQGYIYSYEQTTVPDKVSIMYNGELTEIDNTKHLRYATNFEGENVVVEQGTLEVGLTFPMFVIVCTIVWTVCVLGAIVIRWIFLGRKERYNEW